MIRIYSMRSLVAVLALSLIAPLALAQSADVDVRTYSPRQVLSPTGYGYIFVEVINHGPDTAHAITVKGTANGEPVRLDCQPCTFDLDANKEKYVSLYVPALTLGAHYDMVATATSSTPDPNPANNRATSEVDIEAVPDLYVQRFQTPDDSDPALPFSALITYGNRSDFAAHDVVIDIDFDPDVRLTEVRGLDCRISGSHATCAAGDLPPHFEKKNVVFDGIHPARFEGGKVPYTITIHGRETDDLFPVSNEWRGEYELYRAILVTNVDDDGEGSLRRAMENANADPACDAYPGCKVTFRIDPPLPASGFFTITPRSPLPAIARNFTLDGRTQTRFTGETNRGGPEIELSGLGLKQGSGVTVATCGATVRDLAIDDFPGNGVDILDVAPCAFGPFGQVARCYLSRNTRGIVATNAVNERIDGNVITDNRRSGIFYTGRNATIVGNTVIGNGASGVYVNARGATVERNTIANHPDFGLAVDRASEYVDFHANAIFGNAKQAIDLGLDGPGTPFDVQPPRLTRAVYDPDSGLTTIEGDLGKYVFHYATVTSVDFFANDHLESDGSAQAMTYVDGGSAGRTFKFNVKAGDLSGKFLTATETLVDVNSFVRAGSDADAGYYYSQTSELSAPIAVTRSR